MMYNQYRKDYNQTSNELENILNSTSLITAEVIFESFYCTSKTLKPFLEKGFAQGVDINSQDNEGYTFLSYSYHNSLVDLVQFLLEKGANPNLNNLLHKLASAPILLFPESNAMVKLLLQYGALVDLKRENGWIPIQAATRAGNIEIAKLLIQNGADINVTVSDETSRHNGKSLIELAQQYAPVLKLLLILTIAIID